MSRNPDYQFVSTDTNELISDLVAGYESITGVTVLPASPEKLFIQWVASIILQERVWNNYTGNQNIPSRASGENLDALSELFYGTARPAAQSAVCTMRCYISEAQATSILVPVGTRVTDGGSNLIWETVEDAYVPIGDTYIDVRAKCQTAGTVGNGYAIGQINTAVDLYDYYSGCSNITVSDGGADEATDEEFYELMRSGMDGYSCAGSVGGYIYFAKRVSTEIADVVANTPSDGRIALYVLMEDGSIAGDEIKSAVLAASSADTVRPLTDYVTVEDPETVSYDIALTYYIQQDSAASSANIEAAVRAAVDQYVSWQSGKLGRDINPDKLREYLSTTGIKRIVLHSPSYTVLRNGRDNTIPQVAAIGTITLINGGYEDE